MKTHAFDSTAFCADWQKKIEIELDRRLPEANEPPARLHAAMRHSVLAGGKRLRPLLSLAAAEAIAGNPAPGFVPGLALELLHTYSLIHDDLPAMDNDAFRRGRPACHVVFGEAVAILAGDALQALSFEWLADCRPFPPWSVDDLIRVLAHAAGSRGMCGGQADDLAAEGQPVSLDHVASIHQRKTGALFEAAISLGAMAAGAQPEVHEILAAFGRLTGQAFQITDDILGATATSTELGKPVRRDEECKKATWPALRGVEAAKADACRMLSLALEQLKNLPDKPIRLASLADYLIRRIVVSSEAPQ